MSQIKESINRSLRLKRIKGPDKECKYYPCHFEGQDCTWCFCPFYPCGDPSTGGKHTRGGKSGKPVWSCEDCSWIHRQDVAGLALHTLSRVAKKIENVRKQELAKIRRTILEVYPVD